MKTIEKTCYIYEDIIELRLEDTRDNYIVKNALGDIGAIYISKEGMQIYANSDISSKIYKLRNKELLKELELIFKTVDFNPLSSEYYDQIMTMINDKTLESMGYKITKALTEEQEDEIEITEWFNTKYNKIR